MHAEDLGRFKENQLKIITFNFDRSFERRLCLMLSAMYGLNERQAGEYADAVVPVIHVHGLLGTPSWVDATALDRRNYEPLSADSTVGDIRRVAESIRLIHEPGFHETLDLAKEWLRGAQQICFIGFGYHPTNLDRLGFKNLSRAPNNIEFHGSCLGMEKNEIDSVSRQLNGRIQMGPFDALQFLRKSNARFD
jgi:hypothetical protein